MVTPTATITTCCYSFAGRENGGDERHNRLADALPRSTEEADGRKRAADVLHHYPTEGRDPPKSPAAPYRPAISSLHSASFAHLLPSTRGGSPLPPFARRGKEKERRESPFPSLLHTVAAAYLHRRKQRSETRRTPTAVAPLLSLPGKKREKEKAEDGGRSSVKPRRCLHRPAFLTAAEDCRRLSRSSSLRLNVDHYLLPPFKTSRCIATWNTSKVEAAAALLRRMSPEKQGTENGSSAPSLP
nr:hypothetical protein Iba_chr10aCG12270 [Ipomoea batatas]